MRRKRRASNNSSVTRANRGPFNCRECSSLNARRNSIIVGVSFEAKMRLCAHKTVSGERCEKENSRIQYGLGPIGASIARLMREKQAIEIIGAIDTDPGKSRTRPRRSRRREGRAVGRESFRGSKGSAGAGRGRGYPFDVIVARESDGPVADVPGGGVVHRFDLRGIVLSLSDASELAAKLDTVAKEWGVALVVRA